MTVMDYGTIVNGVCTGMIVLDPDTTDPDEFGNLIGAELVAREDHLDGHWGAGALWDGSHITIPEPQPMPEGPSGDPEQPPTQPAGEAPVTREEFTQARADLDWVINYAVTGEA